MPQPPVSPIRFRLGLSGWTALASGLILLVAILAAVIFLALGFFIFLLPAMILAPVLYYFMPGLKPAPRPGRGAGKTGATEEPTIIDGEFRVINDPTLEDRPRPDDDTKP
jgi:hypothetical protein